jgi:homoserine dehydrogenase
VAAIQEVSSSVISAHSSSSDRARVGLLGCGTIGRAVVAAIAEHPHLNLDCVGALVRDAVRPRRHIAVDSAEARDVTLHTDPNRVIDDADVIVEVLGGVEPARTLVTRALERGVPVVTANKTLMAAHGPELRELARRTRTPLLFEAAVVAGVPFVGAIARRPLLSGVTALTGILNGTSHFITTGIERGGSFEAVLADAQANGYAEPDSTADVSGRDAAEKLTILLHLCGAETVRVDQLCRRGIDTLSAGDLTAARALGGTIKPIAHASLVQDVAAGAGPHAEAGSWVGPAFVPSTHTFAQFSGVTNALHLQWGSDAPVLFAGPGAGPAVTAATILDDIVEALTAKETGTFTVGADSRRAGRASIDLSAPPPSRWFLRLSGVAFSCDHVAEFLASRGVPALRIESGAYGIAAATAISTWPAVSGVADTLASLGATVTLLPALSEQRLSDGLKPVGYDCAGEMPVGNDGPAGTPVACDCLTPSVAGVSR